MEFDFQDGPIKDFADFSLFSLLSIAKVEARCHIMHDTYIILKDTQVAI